MTETQKRRHTLLLVDDEQENLDLLRRVFRGDYELHFANSGTQALEILQSSAIDLLLTDFKMPGMNGVELMEQARKRNPLVIRIVLTGYSDPQDIIDAINRGEAHRYLTKPYNPAELKLAVAQALESYELQRERARMIDELALQNAALLQKGEELRRLNEELERRVAERTQELAASNSRLEDALAQVTLLARTDALTGVWNRRYFFEMAGRELERADRYGGPMALLMIDLDHFKAFNDHFGHQAGDQALMRLARVLQDSLRSIDLCGRYGGEEFVIMLPQTDKKGSALVASRLIEKVADISLDGVVGAGKKRLTCSIGVAMYPDDGKRLQDLVAAADAALYKAKGAGRNRVEMAVVR